MSDRASISRLENLAKDALRREPNLERALQGFAEAVWREKQLVRFLLLPYLQQQQEKLRGPAQYQRAEKGRCRVGGAAQPNDGGRDQKHHSGLAQMSCVRSPSPSQLRGDAVAHRLSAKTILDTFKTSDGRAWGRVSIYELPIIASSRLDSYIAEEITRWLGAEDVRNKNNATVADCVPPPTFHAIKQRAQKMLEKADAAQKK